VLKSSHVPTTTVKEAGMVPNILKGVDQEHRLILALCILFTNPVNGLVKKTLVRVPDSLYGLLRKAGLATINGVRVRLVTSIWKRATEKDLLDLQNFVNGKKFKNIRKEWDDTFVSEQQAHKTRANFSFSHVNRVNKQMGNTEDHGRGRFET